MTSKNNNVKEETFKTQLDKAADNTRERENQKPNPIVEKSKSFGEHSAKVLPVGQSPPKEEDKPPGPPERPHHDHKIEDFVRDQHRSQGIEGVLGQASNDE
ncbi:hypothetical protein FSPOR_2119 [Fusarium sporotrichioides]|uniref:Uncharacterized protein n=1 Tax=Fusarium sporotrichioides TaxID=5514 RepID=A0A395SN29_FUSSP|nr:hypothetical protein FSPOR_2119 [Fusarium sporotrichioides]